MAESDSEVYSTSSPFLQVVEVFKPVKEVNAILQAVGADPSAYYSPQEVFALVMQYVQEQVRAYEAMLAGLIPVRLSSLLRCRPGLTARLYGLDASFLRSRSLKELR